MAKVPDCIDFALVTSGVAVACFWRIDGRSVAPRGTETRPAGFDLDAALSWCEANGCAVRHWDGRTRAWKRKHWPVRTWTQILRKRAGVE